MISQKNNLVEYLVFILASKRQYTKSFWFWIGNILTAVAFLYIIFIIFSNSKSLLQFKWDYANLVKAVIISLGLYLLALISQFIAWGRMISHHRKITWLDVEIYARTTLMRSLPGGAWHWIGRTIMYSGKSDSSNKVIIKSSVVEWGIQLLIGASLISISITNVGLIPRYLFAVGFLVAAVYIASMRQPHKDKYRRKFGETIIWVFLYSVAWILSIFIFVIFFKAISGVDIALLPAIRIWSIAGELSLFIIFMPTGLGLREITLSWLLQSYLPLSIGAIISLTLRLIYVIGDFIWGILGWKFSQKMNEFQSIQNDPSR